MRPATLSRLAVAAALLALPLFADDPVPPKSAVAATGHDGGAGGEKKMCAKKCASKNTAGKKPAEESRPAGTASMRVARDPETGELRLPTPEENERLNGRRPAFSNRDVRTVVLPDGTEMIFLDEAHMSSAVARRNADGSITHSCVHDSAAAAPPAKAAPAAPAAPRAEEK